MSHINPLFNNYFDKLPSTTHPDIVNVVVVNDLCIGCSVCAAVYPKKILSMVWPEKGELVPKLQVEYSGSHILNSSLSCTCELGEAGMSERNKRKVYSPPPVSRWMAEAGR